MAALVHGSTIQAHNINHLVPLHVVIAQKRDDLSRFDVLQPCDIRDEDRDGSRRDRPDLPYSQRFVASKRDALLFSDLRGIIKASGVIA